MENITSLFGGIIALAFLGLLLFFELAREQMLLVYFISALIIILIGAMLIAFRALRVIIALIRLLRGEVSRIKPEMPEKEGEVLEGKRKIEQFLEGPAPEPKKAIKVKNPVLKKIARNLRGGESKKSRFSGLAKRLKGIRIPRPKLKLPKIRIRGPKLKVKLPKIKAPKIKLPAGPKLEKTGKKPPKKPVKKPKPEKPTKEKPKKPEPVPREIPPAKPKPVIEEKPEIGEACQICGKASGLKIHYIVPLNKGGTEEKENTILLCGTHKKEAEQGMFSEGLLRKLKNA